MCMFETLGPEGANGGEDFADIYPSPIRPDYLIPILQALHVCTNIYLTMCQPFPLQTQEPLVPRRVVCREYVPDYWEITNAEKMREKNPKKIQKNRKTRKIENTEKFRMQK